MIDMSMYIIIAKIRSQNHLFLANYAKSQVRVAEKCLECLGALEKIIFTWARRMAQETMFDLTD